MTASKNNKRRIMSSRSLNSCVKSICGILRHSNCAGALQYIFELTWMLFLRVLEEKETGEAELTRLNYLPYLVERND